MSFYIDVQAIGQQTNGASNCTLEVSFSDYTENDTQIEQIITKGLSAFQKRNTVITIKDGQIEFFEERIVKLTIECEYPYTLTARKIEDLKQELIVIFKSLQEEKDLNSRSSVRSDNSPNNPADTTVGGTEAGLLSREQMDTQFQNLKKEFNRQLLALQEEIKNDVYELVVELQEEAAAARAEQKKLQKRNMSSLVDILQEMTQKEKRTSTQLKKKIELTASNNEAQTLQIIQALKEQQELNAGEQMEKMESLKEQLSSELDENNFELKDELNQLKTAIQTEAEKNQKLSEDIQGLIVVMNETQQLNGRITAIETALFDNKKQTAELTAAVQKLPIELDIDIAPIKNELKQLEEKVYKKIEKEISRVYTGIQQKNQQFIDRDTFNQEKKDLNDQMNDLTAAVQELSTNRSIEQVRVIEREVTTAKEQAEINLDEDKAATTNISDEKKNEKQAQSDKEILIEKKETAAETEDTEEEKSQPLADSPEETLKKQPERIITKESTGPKEVANSAQKKADEGKENGQEPSKKITRQKRAEQLSPVTNPLSEKHQLVCEGLNNAGQEGRHDKTIRLGKWEYRKIIANVNYLQHRWDTILSGDPAVYEKYGLSSFEDKVEKVSGLVSSLKSTHKKESFFNQNILRVKESVWQTVLAYQELSLYLEEIVKTESENE